MKTLKKSLCLILALVFVLSLCTIGVGAAFTDDADIKYDDAVGIMADLGILSGMGDGSFAPKATVTRAQAAKMIAYMILGKDNAERMPATSSFSDVKAGDWYAKYVGYCAKQGIINGMGDGTFRPDDAVTGTQLAKMILCAVGFGKADEYVGSGWDFNAVADALTEGIYDNSEADVEVGATREECALYVFNALNYIKIQSYKDGEYVPGAQTYGEKVWKLQNVQGIVKANKETGAANTVISLYDSKTSTATDYTFVKDTSKALIGHKVRVLFKGDLAAENKNVYAITDLSTTLKKGADVTGYAAGKDAYDWKDYSSSAMTAFADAKTKAAADLIVCGKEVIGKVLADTFTITEVTVDKNVKTGEVEFKDGQKSNSTSWVLYDGIKKGDYVEIQKVGAKFIVTATESVSDIKLTQKTNGKEIYNNGAWEVSPVAATLNGTSATLKLGGSYTLYLDRNGKFFFAKETVAPKAAADVVYFVVGYSKAGVDTVDEFGVTQKGKTTYMAQIVKADGTIATVVTAADYSAQGAGIAEATFANDKYTLKFAGLEATTMNLAAQKYTKITRLPNTSTFIASDAAIIVMDEVKKGATGEIGGTVVPLGASRSNLKVTTTTGVLDGDFSSSTLIALVEAVPGSAAKNIKAIWIVGDAIAPVTPAVANSYIYVKNTTAQGQMLIGEKTYSSYEVYIDGEKGEIVLATAPAAAGFYSYTVKDSIYTLGAQYAPVYTATFGGATPDVTVANGICIVNASSAVAFLDGVDLSTMPVVDTRTSAKISSFADLAALKSTDDAVTVTFMGLFNGFATVPMGVIYVG